MNVKYFHSVLSAAICLLFCCGNPAAPPPIPNGVAILNNSNFSAMTNASGRISMIEFYSPKSAACQAMDSSVERIARKYKDTVLVGKVNFLEESRLSGLYYIQVLPTFLFLKGGKEARQLIKNFKDAPEFIEDSLMMIIDSLRT